jgi:hypothetical protein
LKEKGKGGAVQWGKEKKWHAALLQIDVEKDRRMWLLKLERNRSQDLLVTVGEKRKLERGDAGGELLLAVDWEQLESLLL